MSLGGPVPATHRNKDGKCFRCREVQGTSPQPKADMYRQTQDGARGMVPLGTCASAAATDAKQQTVKKAQGSKT